MASYSTFVRSSLSLLPSRLFGFGIYLYLRIGEERRNVVLSSWTTVPFIYHLQGEYVWFITVTNLKSFEPNRNLVEWTVLGSHYSIIFSFNYFSPKIERFRKKTFPRIVFLTYSLSISKHFFDFPIRS